MPWKSSATKCQYRASKLSVLFSLPEVPLLLCREIWYWDDKRPSSIPMLCFLLKILEEYLGPLSIEDLSSMLFINIPK